MHAPDVIFAARWSPPVQSLVRKVEANRRREAKEKASRACKGRASRNVTVRWPVSGYRGVNITWYVFVLGDTSFRIRGECAMIVDCCRRKYEYVCGVGFVLDDKFQDPLDIGIELPGGTPYRITGSWTENFYGEGGF